MSKNGVNAYQSLNAQTGVVDAHPHRLIQMLLDGALSRIALARGHIERKEYEGKATALGRAVEIIGALQSSLDFDQGGEIAENLNRLYDYMVRELFSASVHMDTVRLDAVSALLREIKTGWDAIEDEVKPMAKKPLPLATDSSPSFSGSA